MHEVLSVIDDVKEDLKIGYLRTAIFGDFNTMLKCDYDTISKVLHRACQPLANDHTKQFSSPIKEKAIYKRLMNYDEFRDLQFPDDFEEPMKPPFRPTYKINTKK